jgi:peptide/nickel transport system ATP-binding protein
MADRIKVLLKGTEIEESDTATMLAAPAQDYTKSLWAVRSYARAERARPIGKAGLISVRNVTAGYSAAQDVVQNISFDIHAGRTVAVVGESGSGKSTMARVITGLLPPRQGDITFAGLPLPADYRQRSRDQLRQVQMIYQMADTALNPKLRIRDLIGRPAQMYLGLKDKALDDRIRDLLAMIELEPDDYIDRRPSELSGGQKQRIGIARALAAEPQFIICDEVTSALDQLVAEGILKLLDRLQSELNLAYMFITHDLATVRAIADEVVVMKDGQIVEQGPKTDIFQPPHDPYTDLLLSSVPQMDPNWLTTLLKDRQNGAQNRPKT